MNELTHVIVMTIGFGGYWGKGTTIHEAITKSRWITTGSEVRVIRVDADARINDMGQLDYTHRHVIGVGKVARRGKEFVVMGEFELREPRPKAIKRQPVRRMKAERTKPPFGGPSVTDYINRRADELDADWDKRAAAAKAAQS